MKRNAPLIYFCEDDREAQLVVHQTLEQAAEIRWSLLLPPDADKALSPLLPAPNVERVSLPPLKKKPRKKRADLDRTKKTTHPKSRKAKTLKRR